MRQRKMVENKMCIVCNKEVPLGAISCSCGHVFITKRMLESGSIDWDEQFGVKRRRAHAEDDKLQDLDQNIFTDLQLMRIKRRKSKYSKATTENRNGKQKPRQIQSTWIDDECTINGNGNNIISNKKKPLDRPNQFSSPGIRYPGIKNSKSKQKFTSNRYKPKTTNREFHYQINITENLYSTAVADINRKITNQSLHDILQHNNRYRVLN